MSTRTSCTAFVLVIVTAAVLAALGLAIAAYLKIGRNSETRSGSETSSSSQSTTTAKPPIGTSDGWKTAAHLLQEAMNVSADPCEDFFQYACGGWVKKYAIPPEREDYYIYSYVQDQVYIAVNDSLRAITSSEKSDALLNTKTIYDACLKSEANGTDYSDDVLKIMKSLGGSPIIDSSWNISAFDFGHLLGTLTRRYLLSPIIDSSVGVDERQVELRSLKIDQGTLGISTEAYLDPKKYKSMIEEYKNTTTAIIRALKINVSEDEIASFFKRLMEFETRIAKHFVSSSERRNHSRFYNPFKVSEARHLLKDGVLEWDSYFNALTNDTATKPITDETVVIINEVAFLNSTKYILNSPEYDKEFLANYLMLRLALQFRDDGFLPTTQTKRPNPMKACGDKLTKRLIYTVGRAYVQQVKMDEQDRNEVSEMTTNIQRAFSEMLKTIGWMDEESRSNAQFKLSNMAQTIGWPTWIFDDDLLDAYYSRFTVQDTEDYFVMFYRMVDFYSWSSFSELEKSVNRHDFQMSPAYVNAWYAPEYNSITIPAAILKSPQYRKDFPMAFNYGSCGNTPGHEITHGFDDEGVQYDYNGTLHTWMTKQSQDGFKTMAECVQKQYSEYCYDIDGQEHCLNGKTMQGENIADNGGIRESFNAYQKYIEQHGPEPRLPGLEDFSMDQIYFLSFGYSWCGSETNKYLMKRILTNPHSPPRDRVIGSLSNFEQFGKAFGCKKGDRMYPKNKCDVWI